MGLPALSPSVGGICIGNASMEPADIIVSTTSAFVSGIIRAGTLSHISHAAVYIGGNELVEAIGKGVTRRSIAEALTDDTLAVAYRHKKMTPAIASKVIEFAKTKVGLEYDYLGAAGANPIACVVVLGPIGCAVARHDTPKKFYCSKLVLEAYRNAGVPLTGGMMPATDPQSIVNAYSQGVLEYVGHLKP